MKTLPFGYKVLFTSLYLCSSTYALCSEVIACDAEKIRTLYAEKKLIDSKDLITKCIENKEKINDKKNLGEAYFYLGLIERNKKNLKQAHKQFENALEISPQTVYFLEYAVSLEWDQKLDEALTQYNLILKKDSQNTFALHGKARVLRWKRDLLQSDDIYRQLLAKNPNDLNAKIGRGFIQLMDKNYKRARLTFQAVLALAPNNNEAKLGLEQLAGLKKHTFSHYVESKRKDSETLINQHSVKHELQLRSEFNNKWTGLFNFTKQTNPLDGQELTRDGLSINREAEYKISAYSLYNGFEAKYLAGLDIKKSFSKDYEYQFTIQKEQTIKNKESWYAGTRYTLSKSKLENSLLYIGHIKTLSPKINTHNQFFYVFNPRESNSSALVSTLMVKPSKVLSGSVGISFSDNLNGLEKVLHSSLSYRNKNNFNFGFNFVKNLETKSHEINYRINYTF